MLMIQSDLNCKTHGKGTSRLYATNDFLEQFIDSNTILPAVINLNSAAIRDGIKFDAGTDTLLIKEKGIYLLQYSVQVFHAQPPSNLPLTFSLQLNGGTIINSQTTFTTNTFNTSYVTSTLLAQSLEKGDSIQLVLSAPNPIPNGTVLRIDFASITILEI